MWPKHQTSWQIPNVKTILVSLANNNNLCSLFFYYIVAVKHYDHCVIDLIVCKRVNKITVCNHWIDTLNFMSNYTSICNIHCRELRHVHKQRSKLKKRLSKGFETHKEIGEMTRQEHLFGLKVCV